MELIEKLGIDWRLVIAQVINFLILLAVLYKFLYKPILKILDQRTKKITQGLKDAEKIKEDLIKVEEQKEQKIIAAKKDAEAIIKKAQLSSEQNRQEHLVKTKQEVQDIVAKTKVQIQEEKEKMIKEAKTELAGMVASATQKVLGKSVDEKIDKRIINESIKGIGK